MDSLSIHHGKVESSAEGVRVSATVDDHAVHFAFSGDFPFAGLSRRSVSRGGHGARHGTRWECLGVGGTSGLRTPDHGIADLPGDLFPVVSRSPALVRRRGGAPRADGADGYRGDVLQRRRGRTLHAAAESRANHTSHPVPRSRYPNVRTGPLGAHARFRAPDGERAGEAGVPGGVERQDRAAVRPASTTMARCSRARRSDSASTGC